MAKMQALSHSTHRRTTHHGGAANDPRWIKAVEEFTVPRDFSRCANGVPRGL